MALPMASHKCNNDFFLMLQNARCNFFMEISKELSFGTGQTESARMDERASGNWLTMKIVKNALNCSSRGLIATRLQCNSVAM